MILDNDTRGWIMTAVSGIGMLGGCLHKMEFWANDESNSMHVWRFVIPATSEKMSKCEC
jgi:hypothetical protein